MQSFSYFDIFGGYLAVKKSSSNRTFHQKNQKLHWLTALAQTMGQHCEAVAQTMGRHCEAVAQTMGWHCEAVAQTMGAAL